jgi:hypothetical protein
MVLARHDLNIANMTLGRNTVGGLALNICGLDSKPPQEALEEIRSHKAIRELQLVDLERS